MPRPSAAPSAKAELPAISANYHKKEALAGDDFVAHRAIPSPLRQQVVRHHTPHEIVDPRDFDLQPLGELDPLGRTGPIRWVEGDGVTAAARRRGDVGRIGIERSHDVEGQARR